VAVIYRASMVETDAVDARDAIVEARRMREYRASLLAEARAGRLGLDGLLEQRQVSGSWPTVKVVVWAETVPGVGKVRARRAMERVGIAPDARLGEVDDSTLRALWTAMVEAAGRPVRDRSPGQSSPGSSSANDR
jgi:hypothetical protein